MAGQNTRLLGMAIRRARLLCGLTQQQLGLRLGLKGGAQAIYRWERGSCEPTLRTRRALLSALRAVNPQVATNLQAAIAELSVDETGAQPSTPEQSRVEAVAEHEQPTPSPANVTDRESAAPTDGQPSFPGPTAAQSEERRYPLRRSNAIEYLVLRMADELDVPARRLRAPLANLLATLRAADFTLEALQEVLETSLERAKTKREE